MDQLPKLSYEEIVAQDWAFVGTASQVLEQCEALRKAVDIDEILIINHFGNIELWKAARTQELFAQEVMARLK